MIGYGNTDRILGEGVNEYQLRLVAGGVLLGLIDPQCRSWGRNRRESHEDGWENGSKGAAMCQKSHA